MNGIQTFVCALFFTCLTIGFPHISSCLNTPSGQKSKYQQPGRNNIGKTTPVRSSLNTFGRLRSLAETNLLGQDRGSNQRKLAREGFWWISDAHMLIVISLAVVRINNLAYDALHENL